MKYAIRMKSLKAITSEYYKLSFGISIDFSKRVKEKLQVIPLGITT